MTKQISPKFISAEMTTDLELASEASTRQSEDLTFLKLDGSRAMTGNLNVGGNDLFGVNKTTNNIHITTPTYTTVSSNGTLTLNSNSASVHFLTGIGANYSVVFPNATTLVKGTNYEIYNRSSSPVTLKYFDGSTIGILAPESVSSLILQDNSTSKGVYSPFTVEVAQAAGISNYNASATTPFSTTLINTYQQITDFVVTPASGKYAIWFNCSATSTLNNSINYVSIYKDGVSLSASERLAQSVASNFQFQLNTLVVADFNGAEQLQVWVKVTTGTLTVNARTGVAIRLGPV